MEEGGMDSPTDERSAGENENGVKVQNIEREKVWVLYLSRYLQKQLPLSGLTR